MGSIPVRLGVERTWRPVAALVGPRAESAILFSSTVPASRTPSSLGPRDRSPRGKEVRRAWDYCHRRQRLGINISAAVPVRDEEYSPTIRESRWGRCRGASAA